MPPNWQEFSQENLRHSNQERETSMRLRGVIGQTLSQTSQDMREQADRCEEALSRRVSETEEATRGLEDQLKQVSYKYNGRIIILRLLKLVAIKKDYIECNISKMSLILIQIS